MITLKRITRTDEGTFGVLFDGQIPFAITAERPWLNNAQTVSCIPRGWYTCRRVRSPHFGETFEVTEVPGRTHILFHKGNTPEDSKGCIIVGSFFGTLGGSVAVLSSRKAFAEFMDRLKDKDEFILSIEEV